MRSLLSLNARTTPPSLRAKKSATSSDPPGLVAPSRQETAHHVRRSQRSEEEKRNYEMKKLLFLVLFCPRMAIVGQPPRSASSGDIPASHSQRQVYASVLLGTTGDADVAPGSTATGTDRAVALNAALSGGNVNLVVDGQYGLSTSLVLYSNTAVSCLPGMGFIMQPASDAPVLTNAHHNAPTTKSGTGGYVVSNIADHNIKVEGCTLNANSLQAVTGMNMFSVPHTVNRQEGHICCGCSLCRSGQPAL